MAEIALERLVWRYEHQRVPAEQLDELLREEALTLGGLFENYTGKKDVVRQWNRASLLDFEQHCCQAYRLLDCMEYPAALRQLRQARYVLEALELLDLLLTETDVDSLRVIK